MQDQVNNRINDLMCDEKLTKKDELLQLLVSLTTVIVFLIAGVNW